MKFLKLSLFITSLLIYVGLTAMEESFKEEEKEQKQEHSSCIEKFFDNLKARHTLINRNKESINLKVCSEKAADNLFRTGVIISCIDTIDKCPVFNKNSWEITILSNQPIEEEIEEFFINKFDQIDLAFNLPQTNIEVESILNSITEFLREKREKYSVIAEKTYNIKTDALSKNSPDLTNLQKLYFLSSKEEFKKIINGKLLFTLIELGEGQAKNKKREIPEKIAEEAKLKEKAAKATEKHKESQQSQSFDQPGPFAGVRLRERKPVYDINTIFHVLVNGKPERVDASDPKNAKYIESIINNCSDSDFYYLPIAVRNTRPGIERDVRIRAQQEREFVLKLDHETFIKFYTFSSKFYKNQGIRHKILEIIESKNLKNIAELSAVLKDQHIVEFYTLLHNVLPDPTEEYLNLEERICSIYRRYYQAGWSSYLKYINPVRYINKLFDEEEEELSQELLQRCEKYYKEIELKNNASKEIKEFLEKYYATQRATTNQKNRLLTIFKLLKEDRSLLNKLYGDRILPQVELWQYIRQQVLEIDLKRKSKEVHRFIKYYKSNKEHAPEDEDLLMSLNDEVNSNEDYSRLKHTHGLKHKCGVYEFLETEAIRLKKTSFEAKARRAPNSILSFDAKKYLDKIQLNPSIINIIDDEELKTEIVLFINGAAQFNRSFDNVNCAEFVSTSAIGESAYRINLNKQNCSYINEQLIAIAKHMLPLVVNCATIGCPIKSDPFYAESLIDSMNNTLLFAKGMASESLGQAYEAGKHAPMAFTCGLALEYLPRTLVIPTQLLMSLCNIYSQSDEMAKVFSIMVEALSTEDYEQAGREAAKLSIGALNFKGVYDSAKECYKIATKSGVSQSSFANGLKAVTQQAQQSKKLTPEIVAAQIKKTIAFARQQITLARQKAKEQIKNIPSNIGNLEKEALKKQIKTELEQTITVIESNKTKKINNFKKIVALHKGTPETRSERNLRKANERNTKLLSELTASKLHPSIKNPAEVIELINYFKNKPGALGHDGPITRILTADNKTAHRAIGAIRELKEALELEKQGHRIVSLGNKPKITDEQKNKWNTRKDEVDIDIELEDKFIEVKDTVWNEFNEFDILKTKLTDGRLTDYDKLAQINYNQLKDLFKSAGIISGTKEKKLIEEVWRTLHQFNIGQKMSRHQCKDYIIQSNHTMPNQLINWLKEKGITFIDSQCGKCQNCSSNH